MYQYETKIRVRYAETDKMGFVYYGNYATYFEVARVEMFRALGYPYKELEDEGFGMPVVDYHTQYIRPAKYDNLLTIKLKIPEMPTAKIRFEYEVLNEEGILLNKAETTLVFTNLKTGRPVKIPKKIGKLLSSYYQNEV